MGGLVAVLALVVAAVVLWPDGGGDDVAGGGGTATTTTAPVRTAIDGTALSLVAAAGSAPSPVWDVPFPCAEGCAGAGSEDLVVMASATGEVVALDPAADDGDGAVVWRVDVEGATGVPQVVLAGDLALVEVPLGEAIHRLVALDAASGDARWEAELPGLVRGGVLGEPGDPTLVVMGSDPDDETPDGLDVGSTHVVDVGIGLLWSTLGHPAGVTDDIVVVSDGASLTGHDRRSGSERWSAEVQTGPLVATQALPRGVVAGDVLVAVAGLDAVGLDPADGSERWRTALPARAAPDAATGVVAAATPEGGTAALVGGPEGLVALDPTDGTLLWDVGGGAPVTGDGALLTWVSTHDAVVVGLEGGTLAARDLGDGTTVASATVDDVRQWALLDGQVLARTDGAVVAHDVPGLAPAWEVPVPAQAIVAAPRGFVAATGDAATRYEAPA